MNKRVMGILQDTWRYRAGLPEMYHRRHFEKLTIKAVERVTTRLQADDVLDLRPEAPRGVARPTFGPTSSLPVLVKAAREP